MKFQKISLPQRKKEIEHINTGKIRNEKFLKQELRNVGLAYSEDMMLVCERFTLNDVKQK